MSVRTMALGLIVVACLCCVPGNCVASGASKSFETGHKLLSAGDLKAALKAYASAVKQDRDNQEYLQQYLLVRGAILRQQALAKETDPKKWEGAAMALSEFYTTQKLCERALAVDQAIFDRTGSTDSAVKLAETLLTLERSDEAVHLLKNLKSSGNMTAGRAMLAVALARQGKRDEAGTVAAALHPPKDADPGTLYLTARAQAVAGLSEQALSSLQRCFESVPPSRQDALRSLAKGSKEFAGLASSVSFVKVMATVSKIPESKCSGGSSCSNCPMRGGCSHGKEK